MATKLGGSTGTLREAIHALSVAARGLGVTNEWMGRLSRISNLSAKTFIPAYRDVVAERLS